MSLNSVEIRRRLIQRVVDLCVGLNLDVGDLRVRRVLIGAD